MKTRYAILSALVAATMIACGGGTGQNPNDQKHVVYVETSAALRSDVASVTLDYTGGATGSMVLAYTASSGKFSGNLYLAAGTYNFTLTARNAASVTLGTASQTGVVINSTKVTALTFNIGEIAGPTPTNGFAVTSFSGPGYIDATNGNPAAYTVTVRSASADPTFAWSAVIQGTKTPCPGSTSPLGGTNTPGQSQFTFTSNGTAQICTVTVTMVDTVNSALKNTQTMTLGVGLDVSISGLYIPAPATTTISLVSNGGYTGLWDASSGTSVAQKISPASDPTCTLARWTNTSDICPGTYKVNSGIDPEWLVTTMEEPPPLNPITLIAPTFTIGIVYDLGGAYDATKPPKAYLTASCPNSTSNGTALYGATNPITGSGPGTATCQAGAQCFGSTTLYWTEPTGLTGTSDVCTLTVTVTNQGATDSWPIQVFISQ
jgi:hypothetical protein